jgi:hypothetical protein
MRVFNVSDELYLRRGPAGGKCLELCNFCLCDLLENFATVLWTLTPFLQ